MNVNDLLWTIPSLHDITNDLLDSEAANVQHEDSCGTVDTRSRILVRKRSLPGGRKLLDLFQYLARLPLCRLCSIFRRLDKIFDAEIDALLRCHHVLVKIQSTLKYSLQRNDRQLQLRIQCARSEECLLESRWQYCWL